MKKIITTCCSILIGISQISGQLIKDTDLREGDILPNITLKKVMDNSGNLYSDYIGKTTLQDFRGKLIILDFWTTYCSPCIKGFYGLSALQEKFKNQIQIFLVNPWEDENRVKKWLKQQNGKRAPADNIVPDNLPMLADAKNFLKLFPIRGEIGYHVWIGADGRVKLRGISENTHEKKIQEALSGVKISYIEDNALAYDRNKPYFVQQSPISGNRPLYSSNFGGFDDKGASAYGSAVEDFIDSLLGTQRNTYLNMGILELYQAALKDDLLLDDHFLYGSRFLLEVSDTAMISQSDVILKRKATDADYRHKVCYEQVLPLSIPDSLVNTFMLQDIERFFENYLGIYGRWEERTVPCLKLQFTGDIDRIKSTQDNPSFDFSYADNIIQNNYYGYNIRNLFYEYFQKLKSVYYFKVDRPIIDDTGYNERIDLILPNPTKIKNYEEFEKILETRGFKLKPDSVKLKMFVISML
ncbi:TlpA family protein disulfide reductase [Chitinophaga cymbidii]|uniref:Thioredoxin domain-containing protein n=1 Tax=Chitinophaga cymbidii TaxID=1096750 RepID=A0A512RQ09_9BACT|nr:TlpA disulfide reductase family protein [Chitinophaga cymbidii]GEP97781.1 hypothetical protein CCY01nite_40410 [Chitinophaga cymbidii]